MSSPIKSGETAPDFILKDQHGKDQRLSDYRGKKVVLAFHPLAFTRICAYQMQDLEKHYDDFIRLGAVPLGMSVDPVPSKHAWAKELGIKNLLLLSDFWPHGEVARKLGVFREENGYSERAVIIVGPDGLVSWIKVYPTKERPDIHEILTATEKV
ncbi:MAG TPA: peroxiredoxin [Atribacteraceae bacterium]|nr:peroxiredoxin [Atribacteraceae bacterium]